MVEEMSKRNELLELLKVETLTTNEIVEKLGIPIEHVWTYISQFSRKGKVVKVGKKGRFNLYKAVEDNPIKLLKQLYNIMDKKMKPITLLDENEKKMLFIIEEVLNIE